MICSICGNELVITDQEQPVHREHVIELRAEIARLRAVLYPPTALAPLDSQEQEFTDQTALD